MQLVSTTRRNDLLALLFVLAVAILLRFQNHEVVEYFHDDAMLSTLAMELVTGQRFPFTGILSSTGIPNSPVSVYLLAVPFSLALEPLLAVQFIMLLNVVGVGLLWMLARWQFGWRIALISALCYAINPWATLFSRKIWAQEMHTPLILLGLLLLIYALDGRDRQRWGKKRFLAQCLSLPILVFALQMHFAALALLPMVLYIFWRGRRHVIMPALTVSVLISLIVLLPYALGLAQTLAADPHRVSDAAARAASDGFDLTVNPLEYMTYLASGYGLEAWMAPDQQEALAGKFPARRHIILALIIPLLVGLIVSFRNRRTWFIVLILWSFLPALLLLVEWTSTYIHYFIPTMPGLALLIGLGLDHLLMRWKRLRLAQLMVWGSLILVWQTQIVSWQAALDFVANTHVAYPGFTTPMSKLIPLQERLRQSDDVLVISQGMSWNLHHEVAVWDTLLRKDVTCVRTMRADGYALFPTHAFSVLMAPDAPADPVSNLYAGDSREVFPTRAGGAPYVVYQWAEAPEWTGTALRAIAPAKFDNGVSLTGYGLENGEVVLGWQLPGPNVDSDYQYSAQLFDEIGARLGQWDGVFWHGRHWCEGDRLLTWGPLATGSAASVLKVAMYQLGTGEQSGQYFNANVLDSQEHPIGQSVDIKL